ncbi:CLUMA_CG018201, isoform A [Clunio marinus]|uniref:CLUMA_CG018201, isoform A n=1 Tax=Clunio marinus TaxID=568069 RepID=A0A1J1IY85_9DIPT|nr:CLUMA_CG018201, isoform A [Clunio marinus]
MSQINDEVSQLSFYKHEYNVAIKKLKELKVAYDRSHEKEIELRDCYMKSKKQAEETSNKLFNKIAEFSNVTKLNKKLEKQISELQQELERIKKALDLSRREIREVRRENKNCKDALRENDVRFVDMKNQMDKLLRERDLIANQMMRKTDEANLLEHQQITLQAVIERSNGMYMERVQDIKLMKNEILNLRSQCNLLKRTLQSTADMRHEVFKLHLKLNQERINSKVLKTEMITPLNTHRWRKLKTFDTKRGDLLEKYRRLQRLSLIKSTKIVNFEETIKVLNERISLLESRCNPKLIVDTQEKLLMTRSQLDVTKKRMKTAIVLAQASETDLTCKDQIIAQLKDEINDVKIQFYKERKENSKLLEKLREVKEIPKKNTEKKIS